MIYARRGFPFSQNQLRVLAYEMAVRDGQKGFSPIKRRAGRYWLKGFYQRFPEVRKKMAVNLSIAPNWSESRTNYEVFRGVQKMVGHLGAELHPK